MHRWNDVRNAVVKVPDHVVHREMVSETVLLNIRTGRYHGLNEVGARFFATMREAANLAAAAATLATEYEQPVSRIQEDLATFAGDLADLGLVEIAAQV